MMLLDHPNVARIYHHDEAEGWPYFTMKFVRGGTLADRRQRDRMEPRAAVTLMIKVAEAVHYLHERGMVHRDLKPSNILLDENGEPILSDFGLVKDVGGPADIPDGPTADRTPRSSDTQRSPIRPAEAPTLTRPGGVLGTYAYMSPEQARGMKGAVAPATDIWALGIILHELLVGYRPGEQPTSSETDHRSGERPSTSVPTSLDPMLARIVSRCLVEEPGGRYSSAALLTSDLREWLRQPERVLPRMRVPAILAASILLLAALVTMAILRQASEGDKTKPDVRGWIRSELRSGRPVTLVDSDGVPIHGIAYRGDGGTAVSARNPAGWWTVNTTAATLVEFMDDPGVDEFTLSAEVRGNRQATIPKAGLYVAHRSVTTKADWHFQLEYTFQDCTGNYLLGPPPPGLPAPRPPKSKSYPPKEIVPPQAPPGERLVSLGASQLAAGPGNCSEQLKAWEIGTDGPVVGGPWRQMGIRASGRTFTVMWDGVEEFMVAEFPTWRLDKMQLFLQERPDPPLSFSARGGLGVYVAGGSASFRNVTIAPGPVR
jgi:hypothetical protein